MSICVIPARGGSKRIPRKNIRDFCGRPMIAWPIRAAIDSGCFERIIVSTDDDEIATLAESLGAEAPFRRDGELADDHTPTVPVIADAIKRLSIEGQIPVCCLYATAPFVGPSDLVAGLDCLLESGAPYVLSVTTYAFPIQRALRRSAAGTIEMFDPAHSHTRSQDLEEAWHDAGQFYWGLARTWRSGRGVFERSAYGVALPRHRVQDIDTEEDWIRAEQIMRLREKDGLW